MQFLTRALGGVRTQTAVGYREQRHEKKPHKNDLKNTRYNKKTQKNTIRYIRYMINKHGSPRVQFRPCRR